MAKESNASDPPDGVFGNLPGTRPGMRSPRRDGNGSEASAKSSPDPVERRPPPPPEPPEPPPPPPGAEREAPVAVGPDTGQRIARVEDLAWAGVAVAAEAATVGVRFVSRALDAARKSVDRP
jgi:hypothetical protein